jgi:Carbohydrate-selective porin, OprB family
MNFYAEAGINFMGIWKQRPDDTFGCAAAFSQLSPSISALDRDKAFFAGEALPVRNYEARARTHLSGADRSSLDRSARLSFARAAA